MTRLVLDAGALIAIDRDDPRVIEALSQAHRRGYDVVTPSPVVAQVWRSGRAQARLARTLRGIDVSAPEDGDARRCGELLARTGTTDVVDGFVALLARSGDVVATSDPQDIAALLGALRSKAVVFRV